MDLDSPFATVTPTIDGDVLTLLASGENAFTAGQTHRALGRHSLQGVRKALQRLTDQGVVLRESIGNSFVFRLNRDHLAAEHLIGLARLRQTFLARISDRLASWQVKPVYAAVFGSAARGAMTIQSDVDLLLIRPDNVDDVLWDSQVHRLTSDMTRWVGNDARPLEFTSHEVTTNGIDEPVLHDVLREGLTVFGKRSWLAKRLRKS